MLALRKLMVLLATELSRVRENGRICSISTSGEMRRTGTALMATALALADPRPADLDRYLRTLNAEQDVRVLAALEAEDPELEEAWRDWCIGARRWLRIECLRIPADEIQAQSAPQEVAE